MGDRYQGKRRRTSRFATTDEEPTMTQPVPPSPDPDGDHPTEPLAGVSLLMTAVTAALAVLTAFGLHVTAAQAAALVGAVGALGSLVVWLWGRRTTWSPASVARLLAAKRTQPRS